MLKRVFSSLSRFIKTKITILNYRPTATATTTSLTPSQSWPGVGVIRLFFITNDDSAKWSNKLECLFMTSIFRLAQFLRRLLKLSTLGLSGLVRKCRLA